MSGNELAERYRPKTWEHFVGNEELIKFMRKDIELNIGASYFIEGPSGSGKTTLANIWTTTLLCTNRESGTSISCGICPVCKGEDNLNIHSATIDEANEAKEVIRTFIEESLSPPRPVESKSGLMRQVIIINELQNASDAAHRMLLDAIENAPSYSTWILVTMSPEKFNSTTLEALRGRCKQVSLIRKSDEDVARRLKECLPDLDDDTCKAIGFFSNGNIREAWSILSMVYPLYEIKDITSSHIYRLKAGGCSNEGREELWTSIEKADTKRVKELVSNWVSNSSEETICSLLMRDLTVKLEINDYTSLLRLEHLQQWYRLSIKYPLVICLMGMSCKSFYTKGPILSLNTSSNIKPPIEPNEIVLKDIKDSNMTVNTSQIIFEQLKGKVDSSLSLLSFKKRVNGIEGEDVLKEAKTFRQLKNYFDGN